MDAFKPFLYSALKNTEEYSVCVAAVGVTGDICRAIGNKVLPYCDEIMVFLLENLSVRVRFVSRVETRAARSSNFTNFTTLVILLILLLE